MNLPALYDLFLRHPRVCTDTRHIVPDSLFFALTGARFDGNAFARKALAEGAAVAVVSDTSLTGNRFFQVPDTLVALQALASHHRRQLAIPVVGITGSNGKTTTKELLNAALGTTFRVNATRGNLNNHIGVPLTILGTPPDTELLICEMGANHVGEIAALSAISAPTHGLITNIGQAHLEGFGSLEGVKRGKGELFDFLRRHDGLAFVNGNDPALLDLSGSLDRKIIYGLAPVDHAAVCFRLEEHNDATGFTLRDTMSEMLIRANLYGAYNAINMVAAIAVGRHFGVEERALAAAMSSFTSGANRSEVTTIHGCTVIKDAYNANPSSMEASLRAFAWQYPGGWVITGDMKELGESSPASHMHLLELMRTLPLSRIILVGPEFLGAARSATHRDHRITAFPDIEALAADWRWPDGQAILIKGSRSMQLERLLEA